jgi:outer membrane protein OmpA-like peptidoglycan-associated protein
MALLFRYLIFGLAVMAFSPLPARAGDASYRVIKVEKAPDPGDITKGAVTYYLIDAGKDQGIKAGDLFKISRLIPEKGKRDYYLYVGEVQAIESYQKASLNRLLNLADPAIFPVSQYHTVMMGDRAEPFNPEPEGAVIQEVENLLPSAQNLVPHPTEAPVVEEKIVQQVNVTSKILFDLGKAELREEAKEVLKDIAEKIRNFGGRVRVEGHTCDLGTDAYNLALSKKRAKAVVDYLASKEGISKKKLDAKGFGEKSPLTSDKTEEERSLNRRVEFKFIEE